MPIYQYKCKCGREEEVILWGEAQIMCPVCRSLMERQLPRIAMVKNKGEGGYPSRQKFIRGTAPFVGKGAPTPWLDEDPANLNGRDWCTKKELQPSSLEKE